MSNLDLDELERLLEAATPGPWVPFDNGFDAGISWEAEVRAAEERNSRYASLIVGGEPHEGWIDVNGPDAALIVAAVNSLPALIAAARRAEALEKALHRVVASGNHLLPDETCEACASRREARATLTGEGAPR